MHKSFHTRNSLLNRSTNIRFRNRHQNIIPIYLVDFIKKGLSHDKKH